MANDVRLYYSFNNINFGDQLSSYLIRKITNREITRAKSTDKNKLVAIGSLLTARVLLTNSIIWGTGTLTSQSITRWPTNFFPINRYVKDLFEAFYQYKKTLTKIYAVRGPLTRNQILKFGLSCPTTYGDPAILISQYYSPKNYRRHNIGIILHKKHEQYINKHISPDLDISLISIQRQSVQEIESFIDEVCSCDHIFSTSLHGLIVAMAYGIPCRWLKINHLPIHNDDNHKFIDFFLGVGIEPQSPLILPELNNEYISSLSAAKTYCETINLNILTSLKESFPDNI